MNRRVVVDGWTIDLSLNKFEPQDTFSKSWIEKNKRLFMGLPQWKFNPFTLQ